MAACTNEWITVMFFLLQFVDDGRAADVSSSVDEDAAE
jgi:hypothetical protein